MSKALSYFKRVVREVLRIMSPAPVRMPVEIPVLQSDLLKGRTAFVTGGGRGIGYSIAEAFLRAGARVIVAGRDLDTLESAVEKLSSLGTAAWVRLDLTDPSSFASVLDGAGDFDILVNNGGYVGGGGFGATMETEYDKTLDTNLRGAFFLSQEVARRWVEKGTKGNILNVCSASSLRPGDSPYILSKWGLRSLTLGMARKLIRHGIVVNGIAPGCTNTPQFSPDGNLTSPRNPAGRLVTTVEVANLAVVLVSSLARMVVGDVLYVTGGAALVTFDD